jgi:hypothetical protein
MFVDVATKSGSGFLDHIVTILVGYTVVVDGLRMETYIPADDYP